MASVAASFFGVCGLRHFGRVVAQLIQFGRNRGGRGQLLVSVAELADQLTAHLPDRQSRVEPLIFEVRIRLALPIDNRLQIHQQVRQMLFCQCAPSGTQGIQTEDAAVDFVGPEAFGLAIPASSSSTGKARVTCTP